MDELFVKLYGSDPVKYDFYNYDVNKQDTLWLRDALSIHHDVKIISGDIHFGAQMEYINTDCDCGNVKTIKQYVTSSISAPHELMDENIFEQIWTKIKYMNICGYIDYKWKFVKKNIIWKNTFGIIDVNDVVHIKY